MYTLDRLFYGVITLYFSILVVKVGLFYCFHKLLHKKKKEKKEEDKKNKSRKRRRKRRRRKK